MKIVTMCRGGNVRSVAAKMILYRYFGHEVIAIGADNTNNETKKFLFDWADKIVVMSPNFLSFLKIEEECTLEECVGTGCIATWDYSHKSILLDIGNDVWGDPFNERLQTKIVRKINSGVYPELSQGKRVKVFQVLEVIRDYKKKIKSRNSLDSSL